MLGNSIVYQIVTLNFSGTIMGSDLDRTNGLYYIDWTFNALFVKRLATNCQTGYYYNICLRSCVLCSLSCVNCSQAGCSTCQIVIVNSTTNTTANTTANTTVNTTVALNSTLNTTTTINLTNTTILVP